jgi:hypothetical protein
MGALQDNDLDILLAQMSQDYPKFMIETQIAHGRYIGQLLHTLSKQWGDAAGLTSTLESLQK